MKVIKSFIFLMFLVFYIPQFALACDPEPGPQHFVSPSIENPPLSTGYFEVHNTLNGLPCNQIRCLSTASEGPLLVGTDGGGLMVYENNSWLSFSPTSTPPFPAKTVSTVIEEAGNTWLAGTPDGLVRISHKNGWSFEKILLQGPLSRNILFLSKDHEDLLAGTDNGAGAIGGNMEMPFRMADGMLVTGFSCGTPWKESQLFGGGQGVFRVQSESLFPLRPDNIDLGWVQAFAKLGEILLIGGSKGLFRLDKTEAVTTALPDVWITALGAMPGLTDIPSDQPNHSLDVNEMKSFFDMAVASPSLSGAVVESGEYKKIMDRIEAMLPWFNNPANYSSPDWPKKSNEYFELMEEVAKFAGKPVAAVPLLKGVWIGMQEDGLILYSTDGQRRHFTRENSKLPSNRISAITTDDTGETWIGTTDAGLLRYCKYKLSDNKAQVTVWSGEVQVLKNVADRLFIGTKANGLLVFDPRTLEQKGSYSSLTHPGFHKRVTGLTLDPKGSLWVSGDAGVWRIDASGVKGFGVKDGLSSGTIEAIESDADGRIFAVGQPTNGKGFLSEQIMQFDGTHFISYSRDNVKAILELPPASAAQGLKGLGLRDTYVRNFDVKHASMSLALYEKPDVLVHANALLGITAYLLIGTREGQLAIFDGEGFKPLSKNGPGIFGPIIGLARRPNGDHLIIGEQGIVLFNGENYTKIPQLASPSGAIWQDLTADDLNTDLFWAAFRTEGGKDGGVALYQNGGWQMFPHPTPVKKVAVADPYIFLAEPTKVIRRLK
ncbi:MAG: hypothetical protein HQM09_16585 [Candidatus Riflebacteria bacterium]|nr:hypothetical protein [Candidatus Riflebacteria bacterium]